MCEGHINEADGLNPRCQPRLVWTVSQVVVSCLIDNTGNTSMYQVLK